MTSFDKYHKLSLYTLGLQDEYFIHKDIVDAFAAQTANEKTKDITLFFSLAGLYLFLEKKYTGKQVQNAHQLMAAKMKVFIKINLPIKRGTVTVDEVLNVPNSLKKNQMIKKWCESLWNAYYNQQNEVIKITEKLLTP